ncbi:divergent polysaccharide deacetylase family protein [uncultured Arcobacter sp.]|uniref:divergent polysaccharide deacetylase family protein n=1 Tax=uncultured Arcobacter sp. TaxID=165434 RepID=UPI002612E86E|nr:divergent polysaccharide deacetylase family protein [uncultured Arcobacter sp.]
MTKRKPQRRRKSSKKNYKISTINKFLALLLFSLLITLATYFILLKNHNEKIDDLEKSKKENTEYSKESNLDKILAEYEKNLKTTVVDKYEEYNKDLEKEYIHQKDFEKVEEVLKEKNTKIQSVEKKVFPNIDKFITKEKIEEYIPLPPLEKNEKTEIIKNEKTIIKSPIIKSNRPKLAIVIDDVTLQSQINHIKKIGYVVNISLMPPTNGHKDSAVIAQNLPFALVHFPLQATVSNFEEDYTLKVGDSYEKIEKRVAQIRKWYPKLNYTNNHTGSVFTADKTSMEYLIKALKKYNFTFIDSRTTSKSVVKEVTKEFGMPYIARNIFLDNKKDFNYIQNQLKKAIRIAKKTGSSIAIGHPYPITMKVLRKSKHLLKDVDLVYVNELPIN